MRTKTTIIAALAMLLATGTVQANVIIATVHIGDPGNAADTRYATHGYGSVSYEYNIGKYEVTAGQYTAFLNAVSGVDTYHLYNSSMSDTSRGSGIARSGGGTVGDPYSYSVAADFANRPVDFVTYWDACRFANWLCNGQPTGAEGSGTTETGAYTLVGGFNGTRNAGAAWALASEDEWYKAAYYKGGSVNAGYWSYPTCSDTPPGRNMADASGNNANYWGSGAYPIDSGKYTTLVGEFQNSPSPYGTFDQGGNVDEWNDTLGSGDVYVFRGGAFNDTYNYTSASYRTYTFPTDDSIINSTGFRVVEIPEPVSAVLLLGGGLALLKRRPCRLAA